MIIPSRSSAMPRTSRPLNSSSASRANSSSSLRPRMARRRPSTTTHGHPPGPSLAAQLKPKRWRRWSRRLPKRPSRLRCITLRPRRDRYVWSPPSSISWTRTDIYRSSTKLLLALYHLFKLRMHSYERAKPSSTLRRGTACGRPSPRVYTTITVRRILDLALHLPHDYL